MHRITELVEKLGTEEEWPPILISKINLVLDELGVNIVTYGDPIGDAPREIEFILTSDAEAVTIEIIDHCQAFNPLTDAPVPDLGASLLDRRVGGLGIHLTRTMMDDVRYRREDGKNHITLVAHRPPRNRSADDETPPSF